MRHPRQLMSASYHPDPPPPPPPPPEEPSPEEPLELLLLLELLLEVLGEVAAEAMVEVSALPMATAKALDSDHDWGEAPTYQLLAGPGLPSMPAVAMTSAKRFAQRFSTSSAMA